MSLNSCQTHSGAKREPLYHHEKPSVLMSLAAAMSCYLQAHSLVLCRLKGQYAAVNSCFCHTQKDADHFLSRFLVSTDRKCFRQEFFKIDERHSRLEISAIRLHESFRMSFLSNVSVL